MEEEKESLAEKSQKVASTAQKAKKVASAAGKVAGTLAANAFWIVPALIILIVVAAVMALAQTIQDRLNNIFGGGPNAYISSPAGSTDEDFFGGRIIYKNDEQADVEIEISYKNYVCNVLIDVAKTQNINLKLQLPENIDTLENQYVTQCVVAIVNAVTTPTDGDYTTENYKQGISTINHFGFTQAEKTAANSAIKTYLFSNLANIFNYPNEETVKNAITEVLKTENKTNLDFVSVKLFVKDVVLDNDNSNFKFNKLNYVAFIYMPKKDLQITYASYLFYVESETEVVDYVFTKTSLESPIKSGQIDKTWANANDGFLKELEIEDPIDLKTFTALNLDCKDFLSQDDISICDIAQYDLKNGTNLLQTMFSVSAENVVSYLPKEDCLYFQFTSNIPFAFGESNVTTKDMPSA